MKKDKIIKIFRESADENGNPIKRYLHGQIGIKAYVRSLKISEAVSREAIEDGSVIECMINARQIICGDYIEFKDQVYRVSTVDKFDFKSRRDVKFEATAANYKEYAYEVYPEC